MSDTANITQSILNKARVNKFVLVLDLPEKLKNNDDFKIKQLQFSVTGTIIPEISINDEALRYSGQTMNIPSVSRPIYNDLTVNFVIDNKWENYLVIYNWINLFNDEKESILDNNNLLDLNITNSSERYLDMCKNLSIFVLDEYDNRILKCTYTNAYPKKLNGISFDYSKSEEISSSVTFKFNQFLLSKV